MVLLAKHKCMFCPGIIKDFKHIINQILEVVQHPDGAFYIKTGPYEFVPLPSNVPALPALLNENHVYVGEAPIREFLSKFLTTGATT